METKTIYQRLFEAKKEIGKISKDSTNPFFKSKYFDINSLLEHVEPILEKNELLLLQPIEDNKIISRIISINKEGAVESSLDLPNIQDPQKLGSAITYYRRYTLQSLLGLQAEDDDANTASKETKKRWLTDSDINQSIEWLNANSKQPKELYKHYKISNEVFLRIESEFNKTI